MMILEPREYQKLPIHLPKTDSGDEQVESNAAEVIEVHYQPPIDNLPIEAFSLASLIERESVSELTRHQRIDFELLVWCREGSGRHTVDFAEVDLKPGDLLHVRSGQVHRWTLESRYDAQLVLLRSLTTSRGWKPGTRLLTIGGEVEADLDNVLTLLANDQRTVPLTTRSLYAIRELVVSLLGLDQRVESGSTHRNSVFVDFEHLLGDPQSATRTVNDAAQTLGCSTRTLTRACQEAGGVSPKVLLDRAWALEAQRRLSTGESSATRVAESLGFAELSHFTRFYTRVTGETPSAFVARVVG